MGGNDSDLLELRTCSAEDLMILKLFASRPLDLRDAEGIELRHAPQLDLGLHREATAAAGGGQRGSRDHAH